MAEDKRIKDLPIKGILSAGMVLAVYDPVTDVTYQMEVTKAAPPADSKTKKSYIVNVPNDRLAGAFNNGEEFTAGKSLDDLVEKLLRQPGPYIGAALTSGGFPPATTEVGVIINVSIDPTFHQNDAGAFVSGALYHRTGGGAWVKFADSIDGAFPNLRLSTITESFQATATHEAGTANPERSGTPPAAGTIGGNIMSGRGYYKIHYGAAASTPVNGNQARALPQSRFETESNTFDLNTGSTHTRFIIEVPPGKSLGSVVDLDALNLVITSEYVLINNNFTGKGGAVIDGSGNPFPAGSEGFPIAGCKLYEKVQAVPYEANHRHQITLINS